MWFGDRLRRFLDDALPPWMGPAGMPVRAASARRLSAPAFPSGITEGQLREKLARIAPHMPINAHQRGSVDTAPAAHVLSDRDRTPEPCGECGRPDSGNGGERTPKGADRTPFFPVPARKRTPRAPRRPLHWHEVPDLTWERVVDLGSGCDRPLDATHPVKYHASRLQLFLADPRANFQLDDPPISSGKMARGMFAWQVEQAYLNMCLLLWWHPHRWEGTGGVAEAFRRLLRRKPRYRWCLLNARGLEDGEEHKRTFYFMPAPALARGQAKRKRTPQRTPKRAKARSRKRVRVLGETVPMRRAA